MSTLFIYIIHSKKLTLRANKLQNVLRDIDVITKNIGFQVKTQFILQYEPEEITKNIEEYNKKISYDPIGDNDLDSHLRMLNVQMISNFEKHKDAWNRISQSPKNNDIHLVIEDDIMLLPDCAPNFKDLLTTSIKNTAWDLLILGMSLPNASSNDQNDLIDIRKVLKILPSKEAYCITPSTAKLFYQKTDGLKFTMRIHLSHLIMTCDTLKVYFPKKRVFIDGSKLGICPSSIHPTNILFFNSEFVQMHSFIQKSNDEIKASFQQINKLYRAIENLNSPDAMHLYGLLMIKAGKTNEAKDLFVLAIEQLKKQQGLLNNQTELAINLIILYKDLQDDIKHIDTSNAKYSAKTINDLLVE
jgi:hypothetical protein